LKRSCKKDFPSFVVADSAFQTALLGASRAAAPHAHPDDDDDFGSDNADRPPGSIGHVTDGEASESDSADSLFDGTGNTPGSDDSEGTPPYPDAENEVDLANTPPGPGLDAMEVYLEGLEEHPYSGFVTPSKKRG
jgi:hypothetical protein